MLPWHSMAVMETHLKAGPKVPDGGSPLASDPSSSPPSNNPPGERLRLSHVGAARVASTFAEDVRRGLTAPSKFLYPKYFYDELGSRLFEAITALPEYYPTRAEAEILRDHAGEIVAALGGPVWLLELGSGDGQKTRLVIEALLARQGTLEYVPVDISESAVEVSSRSLLTSYSDLRITGYVGEYHRALRRIKEDRRAPGLTLVLFLGSTLGNLDPEERRVLLREVRALLNPGEGFLLGVDLKKPESVLIPAYDDALGVTAAFNLNLLVRVNRELGGEFDLHAFRHRALYNQREGRVEMHLESRRAQTVAVRELGLEVPFAEGETIHTESSYKFDREQLAALAADTGFEVRKTWTDSGERFASNLLVAR
jgi:L-histidine N-alpha-methyltransferase